MKHLIALSLYCNFNRYRSKFKESFNANKALNQNGRVRIVEDNNWRLKHREFAIMAMLIREIVEIYGHEVGVEGDQSLSYYHLIDSRYLFKTPFCKFNGPMSMTNDLSVALMYCTKGSTLCLNLQKQEAVGGYGFECNWISEYPMESEVLFIGGAYYQQIWSLIDVDLSENYKLYLNAMSALLSIFRGHRPTRKLADSMKVEVAHKTMDILLKMERKKYGPKAAVKRRYDSIRFK